MDVKFALDLTNINSFEKKFMDKVEKEVKVHAMAALDESATVVPVKTGRLRNSRFMHQVSRFKWKIGYSAPYALRVHEIYQNRGAGYLTPYLQKHHRNLIQALKSGGGFSGNRYIRGNS